MIRLKNYCLPFIATALAAVPAPSFAQGTPITLRDSFPIGESGGILCQVQDRSLENKAKRSMFDRSWAVVCRDSSRPVGYIYTSRSQTSDLLARIAPNRENTITCPPATDDTLDGFRQTSCKLDDEPIAYSIFQGQKGNTAYVAEGLTAYDSATLLALKSLINNDIAEGTIDVAVTSIEDPFAFARVQASTLKPDQALAEGYRRNLSGDFAEAAAFFETLQQRTAGQKADNIDPKEYLINRALQKSNLGEFAEADRLFEEAGNVGAEDPVNGRLRRNFMAIHLFNQGRYDEAVEILNIPIQSLVDQRSALRSSLEITSPISSRINSGDRASNILAFTDDLKLTDRERIEIIDAQALQLIGTAQRIQGDYDQARNSLVTAYNQAVTVRDGRVTSITRLRVQILSELSSISEAEGNFAAAEQYLRDGLELLAIQYPQTRSVNGAKARLASYLLRRDKAVEARQLYSEVVESSLGKRDAVTGMANQLAPYFRLLAKDPSAGDDFFKASQILVRPGVAETNAVLARELSGGTDEAARLFRQSTNLSRNIEKLRIRFSALGKAEQTAGVRRARTELATEIDTLERSQQITQVKLADYPQYRAVASRYISLSELRDTMTADEIYARLAIVGNSLFTFYADQNDAGAYRIKLSEAELDRKVDTIRSSISAFENGQYVTYPFDVETSRDLYKIIFEPIAAKLAAKKHLIFEPDGALLRLPINLLVVDDASVESYLARIDEPDGDAFDFIGVNWLGNDLDISTAVSARAFSDARKAPRSKASRQYLGLGENTPVIASTRITGIRGAMEGMDESCRWSLNEWNNPISSSELFQARSIIGQSRSEVLTKAEFTDDQILAKTDISNYRILHFATHGLVTAPRPSCPAKPALLTSFGGEKSDGLLAFDEIFDLKLDADIVLLSACDTAGKASITATREAGVSSGGGTALDGLVRSFIGAGSRSVLASHWPAPDDFQATERLISGLFKGGQDMSVATALRMSQQKLINDPVTSHPYYWSGFAIIGDGARPFLSSDLPLEGNRKNNDQQASLLN